MGGPLNNVRFRPILSRRELKWMNPILDFTWYEERALITYPQLRETLAKALAASVLSA